MFELPELPFSPDAFAPWTSTETFAYHHGKHHAGYLNKLNVAVLGTDLEDRPLDQVLKASRDQNQKVFNLAAQHANHSFFWNCLSPEESSPSPELAALIDRDFGSLDGFKAQFTEVALGHFGSGWAWLVKGSEGKLLVKGFHDAQTPIGTDETPLLTLDVWEHAYYIDHRHDRAAYIEGFWGHVHWAYVWQQL